MEVKSPSLHYSVHLVGIYLQCRRMQERPKCCSLNGCEGDTEAATLPLQFSAQFLSAKGQLGVMQLTC